jgi:hypothetical protein
MSWALTTKTFAMDDEFFILWAILIFMVGFACGFLAREKLSRDRRQSFRSLQRLSKARLQADAKGVPADGLIPKSPKTEG